MRYLLRSVILGVRSLLLLPALFATLLLLGTTLAYTLAPSNITISSDSLLGIILMVFLIPANFFGELFGEMISLNGIYFSLTWYFVLFLITSVSLFAYKKTYSSLTVEKNPQLK